MSSIRKLFLSHLAKTGPSPMMFEVDSASGVFLRDTSGRSYYDLNSGISVSSLGHGNPKVVEAIKNQAEKYLHTMVYGEHIQSPQVLLAKKLTDWMEKDFDTVYFLMSGTEAVELSLKLARKHTKRARILAAANAYHGSTHGSESLRSDLEYKMHFMPLVPGVDHIEFNSISDLDKINSSYAAIICEAIQSEAGVILPGEAYLKELQARCRKYDCLLILDEIQTGFGRTGALFAFQKYNIEPDIVLLGKALGSGMPLSAVVSNRSIFESICTNPNLGHISTFGGHPVSCAAALAGMEVLQEEIDFAKIEEKGSLFQELLKHPIIRQIRRSGLMIAIELEKEEYLTPLIEECRNQGVFVDWFLFNKNSFRIAPPLIISYNEIQDCCNRILIAMNKIQSAP